MALGFITGVGGDRIGRCAGRSHITSEGEKLLTYPEIAHLEVKIIILRSIGLGDLLDGV